MQFLTTAFSTKCGKWSVVSGVFILMGHEKAVIGEFNGYDESSLHYV